MVAEPFTTHSCLFWQTLLTRGSSGLGLRVDQGCHSTPQENWQSYTSSYQLTKTLGAKFPGKATVSKWHRASDTHTQEHKGWILAMWSQQLLSWIQEIHHLFQKESIRECKITVRPLNSDVKTKFKWCIEEHASGKTIQG